MSNFGKNNLQGLKKLFKQVVQLGPRWGRVSLGLLALEGTKVKAATRP
ncbi:hypothetical protein [Candidatus Hakubella thermalkaliphila]|nr:hypothetical protein [Candidatus Hakubella thermalkaliphila]